MQIFSNNIFGNVRTFGDDVYPYFCLADLCKVLDIGNPWQVASELRADLEACGYGITTNEVINKYKQQLIKVNCWDLDQSVEEGKGSNQRMTFVSEACLYRCVFHSRKPEALRFQDWVVEEVLPAIRRTGMYRRAAPAGIDRDMANALLDEHEAWEAKHKQRSKPDPLATLTYEEARVYAHWHLIRYYTSPKCGTPAGLCEELGITPDDYVRIMRALIEKKMINYRYYEKYDANVIEAVW